MAGSDTKSLQVLHLFAGAGGGILADLMLGHKPVGAVEIDPFCRKVLYFRQQDGWLPKFPIWSDVRDFCGTEIRRRVDMVCGGFPCQDISCAGKRVGIRGERSGLFFEMSRICRQIRPEFIFLENSPNIITRGLDVVLCEIAEMGYDAEWVCLPASEVGAWHKRDRWWCLCRRQDGPHALHDGIRRGESRSETGTGGSTTNTQGTGLLSGGADGWLEEKFAEFTDSCEAISDYLYARCGWLRALQEGPGDGKGGGLQQGGGTVVGSGKWWNAEPGVGRVANGVANRVDRIKSLGNGQVPLCAAVAWVILLRRLMIKVG